jgi:predicted DCC family thiol-disulfide oxidoreductase YuxK
MTKTRVLYNDACPICSREIKHYDKLAAKDDLPLVFEPLGTSAQDWGIDPDAAARQIHARRGDELLTGFDAFVAMWSEIPRYRWIARLCSLPVIRTIVRIIYDHVAAPLLYALHKRRQRKARSHS